MPTIEHRIIRLVTIPLAVIFLISAILNFSFKIPVGFAELSFASPSVSIAEFELVIGLVLLAAAALSRLYVYCGAYLFAVVGIVEGLLSSDVHGLARNMHEAMLAFAIGGCVLLAVDARSAYKARGNQTADQRTQEIVTVLQFFVGGLVTLGGAAYARNGTYPLGTFSAWFTYWSG